MTPSSQLPESSSWNVTAQGTLRDTLLPKLLSGEIRVSDAEKRVELGT
jgi:hypothetical protein